MTRGMILLLAGAAVGFAVGWSLGIHTRADLAMRAVHQMQRGMRWLAVKSRKAQEQRARWAAAHREEMSEGETCE